MGFVKLKMAMELQAAVQRQRRALNISRDRERSDFDKLKGHDKFLIGAFRSSTWCIHIKQAFNKKELPDFFVVRNANCICRDCEKELHDCNGDMTGKRKNFVSMQSHMLQQIADLYCENNAKIIRYNQDKA